MDGNALEAAQLAGVVVATDFSVWGLFIKADIIVKSVMVLLFIASIWCWAIIVEKTLRIRKLNLSAAEFEDNFWSGGSLDVLYDRIGTPKDPMAAVFSAAMRDVTVNREVERVERQMTILASTGSTAPFVGLFGTVWGIMNSFQAISITKNTSLAVVAPGIAEALFATALGLVAAIPAVIAYNKISKDTDRYAARLDDFANEFSSIVSRQMEGRK
jgi:biopolymer transport protein TolQ